MTKHLFRFGFESPSEHRANIQDGTDFESSSAIWIEAPSVENALEWGQAVAEAFVAHLFASDGLQRRSWRKDSFANWIEDDANEIKRATNAVGIPTVALGSFPDFSDMRG